MSGGCAGQCCAVFPVGGLSYAELEVRYHRITDGATIFDMVRPLTPEAAAERVERFGIVGQWDYGKQLYRCVRWDEDTRLCTRYDERPEMCTDYPYAHECEHCGYTEPEQVRFRWHAVRLAAPFEWWWSQARRRWERSLTVAALTFPG